MVLIPFLEVLSDKTVYFAANAYVGVGGQGEFLRQMVFALDQLPIARVFSRSSKSEKVDCINVAFRFVPWNALYRVCLALPVLRARRDWLTLLSDLDFDNGVAALVEEVDLFDGVMAQCFATFTELKRRNVLLVLTCQNSHIDCLIETLESEHRRIGFKGYHFIHPRMRERALREIELADAIRVLSERARQTFIERGVRSEKVHVIRPAVDLTHFYPVQKEDNMFRVLASSSIDPRKGIYYLLQAFVDARIPNSELLLIGGTGDRWSKRMLGRFISWNRNIRNLVIDVMAAPVASSYGTASVVVHPALEDGYGLTIPQALAAGRPVIATKESGASELIRCGENGFVVDSRSVTGIRDYLRLLANDRNLLDAMTEAAPHTVTHLSYESFARDVAKFYGSVLSD